MHKGVTLVECMLACAIFSLTALVSFEGIIMSTRIAHENADLLSASGIAWDAVWKRFNEEFGKLAGTGTTAPWVELSKDAAPSLWCYDTPPKIQVSVGSVVASDGSVASDLKWIKGDVEWGNASRRRRLSDVQETFVYRSQQERVCSY